MLPQCRISLPQWRNTSSQCLHYIIARLLLLLLLCHFLVANGIDVSGREGREKATKDEEQETTARDTYV